MIDIINIKVHKKRNLYPDKTSLGTIGENIVTELVFDIPTELQEFSRELIINTSLGSFKKQFSDNSYILPKEVLTDEKVTIQLILKGKNNEVWKSKEFTFVLNKSGDDSGENMIENIIAEARLQFEEDLRRALEAATDTDLSEATWDEMNETVSGLASAEYKEAVESAVNILYDFYSQYNQYIPVDPPMDGDGDVDVETEE